MDEIDKKIKNTWNKIKKPVSRIKTASCPEFGILSRFIEGELNESDQKILEKHLITCNYCLALVRTNMEETEDDEQEDVPAVHEKWMSRAISLFNDKDKDDKERLSDIVLKFAQKGIKVLENLGNILILPEMSPVPVRADEYESDADFITLKRTFSNIDTHVEFEKMNDAHVNMKVFTKDVETGNPLKGLRISLFDASGEIASYIADSGGVFFSDLLLQKYILKIISKGQIIGQISLDLRT